MTERASIIPLLPSPLHRAVASHDREALERLLDDGADPATGDPWANVLALAVQESLRTRQDDLMLWLLDRCPQLLDARNSSGEGMLHRWAVHDGATSASLKVWLDLQAPMEAQDLAGNTPLLAAAAHANPDAIRALVRAGANVQHVNRRGDSALMRAVNAWHDEKMAARTAFPTTLRLLLDSGVDPLLEDDEGAIPSQRLGRQAPATPLYLELRDAEELRKSVFHQQTLLDLKRSLNLPHAHPPGPRR